MALQAGVIEATLTADVRQFTSGMKQAQAHFQQTAHAIANGSASAASALGNLNNSAKMATDGLNKASQGAGRFQGAISKVGVGVGVLGAAFIAMAHKSFEATSTVQELDIALGTVGKSTGVGAEAMRRAAVDIRGMGIEMAVAQRMALTFAQGNLDMAKASKVARVAQDLAVISQSNSTDTANLLTMAIQTGHSQLLKSAGITKYAGEAYSDYAKVLGKTQADLTATERQTAVLNMVIEEGGKVAGTYEAAMKDAGKVLRSMPRVINDIQVEMGKMFVEGLSPVILGFYDLTKATGAALRPGGQLAPVITMVSEAFKGLLEPLAEGIKRIKFLVHHMDLSALSTEGFAKNMKETLPPILAVVTGLSLFGGAQMLRGLPVIGHYATSFAKGGPLLSGMAVLVATSPKLRSAFGDLLTGMTPLIGVFKQIGTTMASVLVVATDALANFVTSLKGPLIATVGVLATTFAALVSAFSPVLLGLAKLAEIITSNKVAMIVLMPVITMLIVKKTLLGTTANGTTRALQGFVNGIKNAGSTLVYMVKQTMSVNATLGQSQGAFAALRAVTVASFRAMGLAAKAFMVELGPILLVMAAFMAVAKLIETLGTKTKHTSEMTEEMTQILIANTDALLANKDALKAGNDGHTLMQEAMLGTGDEAMKVSQAFSDLGVNSKDMGGKMLALKLGFKDTAAQMLISQGATSAIAEQLVGVISRTDDNGKKLIQTLKMMGIEVPESLQKSVTALEQLQDQAENTNVKKMVNDWMSAMLGAKKITQEQITAAYEATQGTDMFGNALYEAGSDAQYLAVQQTLLGNAIASTQQQILQAAYATAFLAGNGGNLGAVTKAVFVPTAVEWTAALLGLKNASEDGAISLEDFTKQMQGTRYNGNEWLKLTIAQTAANANMFDSLKAGKLDFANLMVTGLGVVDTLARLTYEGDRLHQSSQAVAEAQMRVIGSFIAGAKAAGVADAGIRELLKTLGILDHMDPSIVVDVDTTAAKARLLSLLAAFKILSGLGSLGAGHLGPLQKQISAAEALLAGMSTKGSAKAKSGGGGGGGSNPKKDFLNSLKGDALGQQLVGLSPEDIGIAIEDLIKQGFAVGAKKLKNSKMAVGLVRAIGTALQNMSKDLSALQVRLADANAAVDAATSALASLNAAYKEWQRQELGVAGLTAEEKVQAGIDLLTSLRNHLANLQAAYSDFKGTPQSAFEGELDKLASLRGALDAVTSARDNFTQGIYNGMRAMRLDTGGNLVHQAADVLTKARNFRGILQSMQDRGMPASLMAEVMSAGIDAGAELGRNLLSMPAADIQQLLDIQTQLDAVARETASAAGSSVYGADIATLQTAFDAQVTVVDALFQSQIQQAKDAIVAQQAAVASLFQNAITEATANLASAKADAAILTTAINDLGDAMMQLARQIGTTFGNLFAGKALPTLGGIAGAATAVAPTTTNQYSINVTAAPGSDPASMGAQIVELIRSFERANGTTWRS